MQCAIEIEKVFQPYVKVTLSPREQYVGLSTVSRDMTFPNLKIASGALNPSLEKSQIEDIANWK